MTAQAYIEKLLEKEQQVLTEYNTLMNLCLSAINNGNWDDMELYMGAERNLSEILANVTKTENSFFAQFPEAAASALIQFPFLNKQRVQMRVSLREVISRLKLGMERVLTDMKNVNIPKGRVATVQTGPTLIDIEA